MVVGIAMEGLVRAMDGLTNQLKQVGDFADRAQKHSLALGQSYETTSNQLGSSMQGLRGSINERFAAGIAGMEAGLQGNTAGVAKLINQQRLTGTASAATAKAFAGMEASLGLSRDQTNTLSNSLIQTGSDYQISTDKLVGAIDALKSTFPAQALAGMGDKVVGAMTGLQAELGPQLAGPLQTVMKMVMDTSMGGYEKLTKLGIGDVRERLSAAKSSAEAQQILKDAFVVASDRFKSVAGDASTGFFKLGVASEVFGNEAILLTSIVDNFGKRTKKDEDILVDYGKTLSNLKSEVMVPFQQALTKLYPTFLKAFEGVTVMAKRIISSLSKALETTFPKLEKAFHFITLKVIDFAIIGLNVFGNFRNIIGVISKTVLPKIAESFMGIKTAVHWGIIVPFNVIKLALNAVKMDFQLLQLTMAQFGKGIIHLLDWLPGGGNWDIEKTAADTLIKDIQEDMMKTARAMEENIDIISSGPGNEASKVMTAVKDAWEDPAGVGNQLLKDLRDSVANNTSIQREQNDSLKNIEENTKKKATAPQFLDQTANILGRSIEAILGIDRKDSSEEIVEQLRIANDQRAAQVITSSSTFINQES